jgi:putative OPT family oligopeptide transporter
MRLFPSIFERAIAVKGSIAYFGTNLSPALLSVGYIVGLNISILIVIGGGLNWFIAIPIYASLGEWPMVDGSPMGAVDYAYTIWSAKTRYLGVGAMLVGGLWTIIQMRSSLFAGIISGFKAYKNVKGIPQQIERTEKDIPLKWVMIMIVASAVPIFLLYQAFVGKVYIALPMAITMLVLGFLFSAVAGYMAGLVGSSNNPISGVTIATVVVSSLLLWALGMNAEDGPAAAIIIGSVVCCAAAIAGDNMQDLKAGRILGATPYKQQIMQLIGVISAALVIAPILNLLLNAYGFAGHASAKGDSALIAPQAMLIKSVAEGVFTGNLPWTLVFTGMAVAVIIIMIDLHLKKIDSSFRMPILAVAIGFYLPFELAPPILLGGFIHYALQKYYKKRSLSSEEPMRRGLLFSSGLITGEALVGIMMAIPIVIAKRDDVLAVCDGMLGKLTGEVVGIAALTTIAIWLYRSAMPEKKKS